MDEASEGSDMPHFIAWVFFAWAGILLAGLIALYLPVDPGPAFQPKPPAPPAPSWPEMPALWNLPPHVIERMKPLDAEEHATVRPYTPDAASDPLRSGMGTFAARLGLPDPLHWLDDATDAGHVLTGASA
ncbi:hypothetical protein [Kitasatospora purpeofusca]|uniref:hypothetical protein n=1 Tax=Kitasatospora purpeofusca TaxID=67352 RepID=UPI0038006B11